MSWLACMYATELLFKQGHMSKCEKTNYFLFTSECQSTSQLADATKVANAFLSCSSWSSIFPCFATFPIHHIYSLYLFFSCFSSTMALGCKRKWKIHPGGSMNSKLKSDWCLFWTMEKYIYFWGERFVAGKLCFCSLIWKKWQSVRVHRSSASMKTKRLPTHSVCITRHVCVCELHLWDVCVWQVFTHTYIHTETKHTWLVFFYFYFYSDNHAE